MDERGIATVASRDAVPDTPTIAGSTPGRARKRYERLGSQMIQPLIWYEGKSAFDVAQENYAKYSKLNFLEDLLYYLRTGFVVTRPNLFVMGKPIIHDGRRGWFIQMAAGNLLELLSVIPCELEFFAFCRNGDDDMRIVEWHEFIRKAVAANERKLSKVA